MDEQVRTVYLERQRSVHVEEGAGTYGKRNGDGVPRLYIEVRNELGEVVYETWQNGPLDQWDRTTLYFDRVAVDGDGHEIGYSLWS
jgi:hypothetical protein